MKVIRLRTSVRRVGAAAVGMVLVSVFCHLSSAQDGLIPCRYPLGEPDGYKSKVRHVLADAMRPNVSARVIVIPSFDKEFAAGIREVEGRTEAFVIEPSSRIWDTELVEMYESGKLGLTYVRGKPVRVPLKENRAYLDLKKKTPKDYRAIKAVPLARALPGPIAQEIKTLWETMLSSAREREVGAVVEDDDSYYFSMRLGRRGDVCARTGVAEEGSKLGRLTELARTLSNYARGSMSLEQLGRTVKDASGP